MATHVIDPDAELPADVVFELFDYDHGSKDESMGEVRVPVRLLLEAGKMEKAFPLQDVQDVQGGRVATGTLTLSLEAVTGL